jgi:catalase (peroxidase I)
LIAGKNLVYLSALYGGAVRLAFHDAGEIDITASDLMGPDGCLSPISDNAGLMEPDSVVTSILEPMWQNHCDKISRADFWVLFAKLCLEASDPSRRMLIPFYYGRKDNVVCTAGEGRLPGAEGHIEDVSKVFVTQMGLTMDDAGEKS